MLAAIYLGTQGWSYPDWVGPFYPSGAREGDYLNLYTQTFRTVELDTTFYAVPRQTAVDGWRRKTPPGFKLAAKLPQAITHEKRLAGVEGKLFAFLEVIGGLGDRLGPPLAQLPPAFKHGQPEQADLAAFLKLVPAEHEFSVEFRHRSRARPEVLELLRESGLAWCINGLALPAEADRVDGRLHLLALAGRPP